jgi:hypothetical protein
LAQSGDAKLINLADDKITETFKGVKEVYTINSVSGSTIPKFRG